MATYFDDCSSLTNWTEADWTVGAQFSVVSGHIEKTSSVSGDILKYANGAGVSDVEIAVKISFAGLSSTYRSFAFLRGADDTALATFDAYGLQANDSGFRIVRTDDGTTSFLASKSGLTIDTSDRWFRLRANGSNLKARTWLDVDTEPGTWDIDYTDGAPLTAGGSLGFRLPGVSTIYSWKAFGVGTNGDTAPTSAGGSSSTGAAMAYLSQL
jgi:hypothetical protein